MLWNLPKKLTLQMHRDCVEHGSLASLSWEYPAGQAAAPLGVPFPCLGSRLPEGLYVLLSLSFPLCLHLHEVFG